MVVFYLFLFGVLGPLYGDKQNTEKSKWNCPVFKGVSNQILLSPCDYSDLQWGILNPSVFFIMESSASPSRKELYHMWPHHGDVVFRPYCICCIYKMKLVRVHWTCVADRDSDLGQACCSIWLLHFIGVKGFIYNSLYYGNVILHWSISGNTRWLFKGEKSTESSVWNVPYILLFWYIYIYISLMLIGSS